MEKGVVELWRSRPSVNGVKLVVTITATPTVVVVVTTTVAAA
jgi:hypothetical protein